MTSGDENEKDVITEIELEDGELSEFEDCGFSGDHPEFRILKEEQARKDDNDIERSEDNSNEKCIKIVPGVSTQDKILKKERNYRNNKEIKGKGLDKTELEFQLPQDIEEQFRRIKIKDDHRLELCGTMILKIEDTQTITFKATKQEGIMDLGTAIFNCRRELIGIIGYIFGTPKELSYQVICKDLSTCDLLSPGSEFFCAPEASEAYFAAEGFNMTPSTDEEFSNSDEDYEYNEIPVKKQAMKRPFESRKHKARGYINRNPFVLPSMRFPGIRPPQIAPRYPPRVQCPLLPPTFFGSNLPHLSLFPTLYPPPRLPNIHQPPPTLPYSEYFSSPLTQLPSATISSHYLSANNSSSWPPRQNWPS